MTRIIRELGPLAVLTVAAGAVTLWLLETNPVVGSWVLAVILVGHGWVHLMFLFPRPAPSEAGKPAMAWPFDLRASWLAARTGATPGPLLVAGRVLAVLAFVLSTAAALATVGILVPAAWWQGLVVTSSLASLAMLVVWFAPMLVLGILIDVALLWLAIAGPWSPV